MSEIKNLEPKIVWEHFNEILKVPRPSKKEEKIIQFLLDFGATHNLETKRDEIGNVLITKPATAGYENAKTVIQNALRKAFSPEFLNRVDDMVLFRSLNREDIHKIIDLELSKLYKRLNDLGYTISLTEKAKDFIVEKGYDEKFGARPLKRAIQKFIEDPLAEEIIKSNLHEGDKIKIDLDQKGEELTVSVDKGKAKTKTKADVSGWGPGT